MVSEKVYPESRPARHIPVYVVLLLQRPPCAQSYPGRDHAHEAHAGRHGHCVLRS